MTMNMGSRKEQHHSSLEISNIAYWTIRLMHDNPLLPLVKNPYRLLRAAGLDEMQTEEFSDSRKGNCHEYHHYTKGFYQVIGDTRRNIRSRKISEPKGRRSYRPGEAGTCGSRGGDKDWSGSQRRGRAFPVQNENTHEGRQSPCHCWRYRRSREQGATHRKGQTHERDTLCA